jgi:hypothetical protein
MNEYEIVVFEDDRIRVIDEDDDPLSDDEHSELELPLPTIDDIFLNDHSWDTLHMRRYRFRPQYWNFRDYELI